jgi:hypothetical protein
MGEVAQKTLEDYRKAVEDGDYPTQAGILRSLLRMMLHDTGVPREVAEFTAREVLHVNLAES